MNLFILTCKLIRSTTIVYFVNSSLSSEIHFEKHSAKGPRKRRNYVKRNSKRSVSFFHPIQSRPSGMNELDVV